MIAEDFINDIIPSVTPTDTVESTLDWMDEFRVSQLAVVDGKEYKGLIKDTNLLAFGAGDSQIGNFEYILADTFATRQQHFFDLLHLFHEHEVDVLPVVDEDKEYVGVISIRETTQVLAKAFSAELQGGILILSLDYRDYSMAEIGRLVESNNARIVSSFVEVDKKDPNTVELTLKLNTPDLTSVAATLERFGYTIISRFQKVEAPSFESERLDSLFKYLDI